MKILHVLYQSLPQISGSSIRSRDVLLSQQELGLDVIAITSPFQAGATAAKSEQIDGIRYIRTTSRTKPISDGRRPLLFRLARFLHIFKFTWALFKTVRSEQPDVVHAHAMFFCGIPAALVCWIHKKPLVYEVRSLWMFNKSKATTSFLGKLTEQWLFKIERFTMNRADHTVFLNDNLFQVVNGRKPFKKSYSIIMNAVNTSLVDAQSIMNEELTDPLRFGYIGTLTAYEGLSFLVETFQELYDEGFPLQLLIFGDGISKSELQQQIHSRKDIDSIMLMGSVDPSHITKAFAAIDVIVNPRLSTRITNSVTPLKPLEAMAYGKLFIGSDVKGISRLLEGNQAAFLFKAEDKFAFKKTIKEVLALSPEEGQERIARGKKYVVENKSWRTNALNYKSIYKNLL